MVGAVSRTRRADMYNEKDSLSRVHGHGRALRSDTEAEHKTRDEEVWPRVGHALPDAGEKREHGGHEDGASTTKPLVELCVAHETS